MRLSDFLRTHSEKILLSWDEFASTVTHSGKSMDQKALRDHAAQILKAIADDLDKPQSDAEQIAKSRGENGRAAGSADTAAETHADTRIVAGFAIDAMITEYRALRASVLRMWAASREGDTHSDELQQLTRFNEAIDQALTESVARYTEQVHQYTNLFMGMLGHDIRNPLGTIHLSAQLLVKRGDLTPEAAAPIVHAARRIQEIVEMIVDFSRAQARGAMPVHPAPGDLQAVAMDVVGETRVRHPTAIMTVAVQGDTHGEWDKGRVGQLLSNLLQNAVLYGTGETPISVVLSGERSHVTLSVHNHGRVIPEDAHERIFQPRARGDVQDADRAPNGLGLGLYICREIAKAHGGSLTLRSQPQEGTTFRVVLPRRQDGAAAA